MDEKITTICPHCERKMKVKEMYLGKKIRCPKCKEIFKIELYESEIPETGLKTEHVETANFEKTPKPKKTSRVIKSQKAPSLPQEQEAETGFDMTGFEALSDEDAEYAESAEENNEVQTYREPKMKVFACMLPEDPKIVDEINLGVSGLFVTESSKVLITDKDAYVYNSRRYLFGIFPGGKKIASYPLGFPQLRAGMLRVKSMFAMLLALIFSIGISFGGWFILKSMIETLPQDIDALIAGVQTGAFYQTFWWLLIPVAIAVIWILLFWRCTYKTELFKISFSRCHKKDAQRCIKQINEMSKIQ